MPSLSLGRWMSSTRSRRASLGALARLASLAVALVALLGPTPASAQQATFYLDRLNMAGAPDDGIALWRPEMADKTRFYWQSGLGFGLNPFRLENHIADDARRAQMSAAGGGPNDFQLISYNHFGMELLGRIAIQVGLPAVIAQGGGVALRPQSPQAYDAHRVNLDTFALMDVRLDARAILFRTEDRTFKLGASGSVFVPTGNKSSFAGDGKLGGGLGLAAEYDFGPLFVVGNGGMRFRPAGGLDDFSVTDELTWGAGAFVPLRDNSVRLGAQIFGSFGLGSGATAANTPIEWMAEARFALDERRQGYFGAFGGSRLTAGYAPDFRVGIVGGYSFGIEDTDPKSPGKKFRGRRWADHGADTDGDGIPDDVDLCPTDPEDGKPPNPDDGCPALPDRDGDGIPDISDKCPDQPEDFDGIDDLDGCPEDDADKDGIPDAEDACPKEPGEASTEPAKHGCPQFIRRISGSSEIQILKQVQFATAKATILPNSFGILDEVVRLLKANPEIQHLAIEGHTDNRGSDALNEKLSDDRAKSVMQYLVDKGIASDRLNAQGFGPQRPIADNNTPDGRQKNRRVEFHIRSQDNK